MGNKEGRGRKKGAFEYGEDTEKEILKYIGLKPQSTNAVTDLIKKDLFEKIHRKTVARILTGLQEKGLIQGYNVGRIKVWQSLN